MTLRSVVLALVTALFSSASLFAMEPAALLPVPDEASQSAALQTLRDVYKSDFDQAKTNAKRLELAKKLFQTGLDTKDDNSGKYVLLKSSRDLAVQSSELVIAFEASEAIAKTFQ